MSTWCVVENDIVGGWCVASRDVPCSMLEAGEQIADCITQEVASQIVEEHNRILEIDQAGQQASPIPRAGADDVEQDFRLEGLEQASTNRMLLNGGLSSGNLIAFPGIFRGAMVTALAVRTSETAALPVAMVIREDAWGTELAQAEQGVEPFVSMEQPKEPPNWNGPNREARRAAEAQQKASDKLILPGHVRANKPRR